MSEHQPKRKKRRGRAALLLLLLLLGGAGVGLDMYGRKKAAKLPGKPPVRPAGPATWVVVIDARGVVVDGVQAFARASLDQWPPPVEILAWMEAAEGDSIELDADNAPGAWTEAFVSAAMALGLSVKVTAIPEGR